MRLPAHPVALALARAFGGPIAAPSANRSGEPPPTDAETIRHTLGPSLDAILDAGPTPGGIPSTLVDVYDIASMPPTHVADVALFQDPSEKPHPGWISFSIDGKYAYPSTGDVIEVASRKIVAGLKDENGIDVQSEKMLEIDFRDDQPVRAGDQFGIGRLMGR